MDDASQEKLDWIYEKFGTLGAFFEYVMVKIKRDREKKTTR